MQQADKHKTDRKMMMKEERGRGKKRKEECQGKREKKCKRQGT